MAERIIILSKDEILSVSTQVQERFLQGQAKAKAALAEKFCMVKLRQQEWGAVSV